MIYFLSPLFRGGIFLCPAASVPLMSIRTKCAYIATRFFLPGNGGILPLSMLPSAAVIVTSLTLLDS